MNAAQHATIAGRDYIQVPTVPHNVRWDTPRRYHGQAVQWAFGGRGGVGTTTAHHAPPQWWAQARSESGPGDAFARWRDLGTNEVIYYRRADTWHVRVDHGAEYTYRAATAAEVLAGVGQRAQADSPAYRGIGVDLDGRLLDLHDD